MGVIRQLDRHVVNQIAAGEVIERPASVVKELVENAIDAGARQIVVRVEDGGIERIEVVDDGCGIAADDLEAAVSPHATSKLETAQQLEAIGTLGFRGEALAAIASVSRLSIVSRPRQADHAMRLDVDGRAMGRREGVPEAGPAGTTITVRNLFFNTPARRKFLRTIGTEMGHVLEAVHRLALSQPSIGFRLVHGDKVLLDLEPGQSPRDRVLGVLGKELARELLEVSTDGIDSSAAISLWGLIGTPAIARGSGKYQHVFLNGRWVRDRTVLHALKEGYRGLLDPMRFATGVLHIEMDPSQVDVNVHPAKAEVRFRNSQAVHGAVLSAVRQRLAAADLTPVLQGAADGQGRGSLLAGLQSAGWDAPTPRFDWSGGGSTASTAARESMGRNDPNAWPRAMPTWPSGPATEPSGANDDADRSIQTVDQAARRFVDYFKALDPKQRGFAYREIQQALQADDLDFDAGLASGSNGMDVSTTQSGLRVLQVHESYLVIEDADGLCIVDQHALHERVMFEDLKARILKGNLESQRLLMPAVVDASPAQMEQLDAIGPLFERIGIEAQALGEKSVAVHAFASFLFERNVDPVEFVAEVLDKAIEDDFDVEDEAALHEVLDMMSCKAAVKAGDRLEPGAIHALLDRMQAIERSSRCPHGRPTTIRLSLRDLEKQFGRR